MGFRNDQLLITPPLAKANFSASMQQPIPGNGNWQNMPEASWLTFATPAGPVRDMLLTVSWMCLTTANAGGGLVPFRVTFDSNAAPNPPAANIIATGKMIFTANLTFQTCPTLIGIVPSALMSAQSTHNVYIQVFPPINTTITWDANSTLAFGLA